TFGTSPALDSAVLVLKYADEYAGDVNSRLFVEVEQLGNRLTATTNYYNTTDHPLALNSVVIGSNAFKANLKDSMAIVDVIKGKPDANVKKAPQLRIPISAQFIEDNFFNKAASNFVTNSAFNDMIKGLHLKV